MSAESRVVLLEFNELTPSLMERFIVGGDLPNFRRLHEESRVFTTTTTARPPYLEPWIQWVTVHTGLEHDEHGLFHLNEGHKLKGKRIWDTLSLEGIPSCVWGSMNVAYEPSFVGCLVPDPWCTEVRPTPASLETYLHFVQKSVLEHTNDRAAFSWREYVAFCRFLVTHGLSAATALSAIRQVLHERAEGDRWKRAVILDRMQFDVFRSYWSASKARFGTFFLNSTAHYQHAYWHCLEPDTFQDPPTVQERSRFAAAIPFGYREMDRLIGYFLDLAGEDTTLVFSTGLSQQPCPDYKAQTGQVYYRPHDFAAVLHFAAVEAHSSIAPVMSEQFHVEFSEEGVARKAERKLLALHVGDRRLLDVERRGNRIFAGCRLHERLPEDTVITIDGGARTRAFFELFYPMATVKAGVHHPDGMLWIRMPDRVQMLDARKVPLSAVAPTLFSILGMAPPKHMKTEAIPLTARGG